MGRLEFSNLYSKGMKKLMESNLMIEEELVL